MTSVEVESLFVRKRDRTFNRLKLVLGIDRRPASRMASSGSLEERGGSMSANGSFESIGFDAEGHLSAVRHAHAVSQYRTGKVGPSKSNDVRLHMWL